MVRLVVVMLLLAVVAIGCQATESPEVPAIELDLPDDPPAVPGIEELPETEPSVREET